MGIFWKILFKRNMAEKEGLFTLLMATKGKKKRINKSLSKHSKQFLLLFYIFWFKGLIFKTQFKI